MADRFERVIGLPHGVAETYDYGYGLVRDRSAVKPLYSVRVQHQLAFRLEVVEYCHFLVANDGQLLLFEGVQPADEDMCLDATGKLTRCQRRIDRSWINVGAAVGADANGSFFEQEQDGGDVMGSKAPQDIFLGPQLAQVEA